MQVGSGTWLREARAETRTGLWLPSALVFLKQKLHCECGFHLESAATCSCHEEKRPCQLCASQCVSTAHLSASWNLRIYEALGQRRKHEPRATE